jgi:hypothetical protein
MLWPAGGAVDVVAFRFPTAFEITSVVASRSARSSGETTACLFPVILLVRVGGMRLDEAGFAVGIFAIEIFESSRSDSKVLKNQGALSHMT